MRFSGKRTMKARNRRVMAETEIADEAYEMLFEAEDVAQLVSDVTGEDVEVSVDGDKVEFAVGEDTYVVEAEGDEEMLESSTRIRKSARKVSASTRRPMGRSMRTIRRK